MAASRSVCRRAGSAHSAAATAAAMLCCLWGVLGPVGSKGALAATGAGPMEGEVSSVPSARNSTEGGMQLWGARYGEPDNDAADSLGVSPDGNTVYVTGQSLNGQAEYDFLTVAYSAQTARVLWRAQYNGPDSPSDIPFDLQVSPDGERVYVTGESYKENSEFATVAYDAATGAQLWAASHSGPGNDSVAEALTVSPDGARVLVTGPSDGDYVTVAYDGARGAKLWVARYDGPAGLGDGSSDLTVDPDGSKVFVTGQSIGATADWATVAYDADTGSQLWATRYDGPAHGYDEAEAVAAAPDGTRVYVTGRSSGVGTVDDYTTVAYDTTSGGQLWVARYDGPDHGIDIAVAVANDPGGARVYVTGLSQFSGEANDDYATIAYDPATGQQLWVARFTTGIGDASTIAVSPDGSRVYVTGQDYVHFANEYVTVAYDASTGALQWKARYKGPNSGWDDAYDLAVSPDGHEVYVTGASQASDHSYQFATIAYTA